MKEKIIQYLSEMAGNREEIVLPGLGSFLITYTGAKIDNVQGYIYPPSRKINFNENLRVDDGKLTQYISVRESISLADAESLVQNFVSECKSELKNNEIIPLGSLGRLYRDFMGKIQFVQDQNQNFNAQSFGLGRLQYYPILRSETKEKVIQAQQKITAKTPVKTPETAVKKNRWGTVDWTIGVGAMLLIGVIALPFFLFDFDNGNAPAPVSNKIPVDRTNIKPVKNKADATVDLDGNAMEKPEYEVDQEDIKSYVSPVDKKAPDYIVIVEQLKSEANVSRVIENIFHEGYEPFIQDRQNGAKRVGIELFCEAEDLEFHLERIKSKFNKEAWLMTK